MPRRFRQFRLDEASIARLRSETSGPSFAGIEDFDVTRGITPIQATSPNDESAARGYLTRLFSPHQGDDLLTSLAAPERPELVPDLRIQAIRRTPGPRQSSDESTTEKPELERPAATLVSFVQTRHNVPIFGSHAKVTLDRDRTILAASAMVAPPPEISPIATLSANDALARIAQAAHKDLPTLSGVASPQLEFFDDEKTDTWHLVFHFSRLPAVPDDARAEEHDHGLDPSPRSALPQFDWLVDAHDGSIVFTYSSNPTALALTDCEGVDESGETIEFYGAPEGEAYVMFDPARSIRTFDFGYNDIMLSPFPPQGFPTGIISTSTKPWKSDPGAVSAHVNAMRVQQFYFDVLGRNSIDDNGMELVSVVNCTYNGNGKKQWRNAVWYNQRMWYGQMNDTSNRLRSFAQYLDIIGHELTHGITQYTARLVYKDLSGALNESISDILGVIIYNWYKQGAKSDVSTWSWKIGDGLGPNGAPIRDMEDPTRLNYPKEFKDRVVTTADNGGVHSNSNIHNYAAYRLLTAGAVGARPVSGKAGAMLYYMALQRLGEMADFSDARKALDDSAMIYFGEPNERAAARKAIADAYDAAGIE